MADLTLGGGGHSLALLQAGVTVLGFDREETVLHVRRETAEISTTARSKAARLARDGAR